MPDHLPANDRETNLLRIKLAATKRALDAATADRARLIAENERMRSGFHPDGALKPRDRRSQEVGKAWLIDVLREHGPMTAKQLVALTGKTTNAIRMAAMYHQASLVRLHGRVATYSLRVVAQGAA